MKSGGDTHGHNPPNVGRVRDSMWVVQYDAIQTTSHCLQPENARDIANTVSKIYLQKSSITFQKIVPTMSTNQHGKGNGICTNALHKIDSVYYNADSN